jgi:iron complex outermembrane recepter protein
MKTSFSLLTFLALASSLAVAEVADIETVLVTGNRAADYKAPSVSASTKNSQPLIDTPVAVQVVPRVVLQDQQAASMNEALNNVSGVTPMFYLGGAYERFVVRGFTQSLAGYRNGVLQPFTRFHLANTERVEVLKGPAALEYGMSDPGGIINVVTRKPTQTAEYSLEQSVSSLDEYRTQASASGSINDALLYRVDASYLKDSGFRELTDTQEYFIAPSFTWNVSDSTRIDFNLEIDSAQSVYDQGLLAIGDGLLEVPRERSFGQAGLLDDYDNRLIDLSIEHDLNAEWTLKAGYSSYTTDTYYRSFYAVGNDDGIHADRYAWFGPEHFDTNTRFVQLNGSFATGAIQHHIVVGAQLFAMDGDARATDSYVDTIDLYTYRSANSHVDTTNPDLSPEGLSPQESWISLQDDRAQGVFIQDQMTITDTLIAQLGVRYDSLERKLDTAYYSDFESFSEDDHKTSPRAGLLYKITPQVSTYISYSTSFGPAFNYEPSALFEPETAKQWEAGFKSSLLNDKVSLTASIFHHTRVFPRKPSVLVKRKAKAWS